MPPKFNLSPVSALRAHYNAVQCMFLCSSTDSDGIRMNRSEVCLMNGPPPITSSEHHAAGPSIMQIACYAVLLRKAPGRPRAAQAESKQAEFSLHCAFHQQHGVPTGTAPADWRTALPYAFPFMVGYTPRSEARSIAKLRLTADALLYARRPAASAWWSIDDTTMRIHCPIRK